MNTLLKNLFVFLVTLLLGIMSSGVRAQTYNATVNGTNYDFTYFTGTYNDNISKFSTTLMPWWGSQSTAETFTSSVGDHFGYPNTTYGQWGPYFAFSQYTNTDPMMGFTEVSANFYTSIGSACCAGPNFSQSVSYAVATATGGVAPEMNASLIPQVGLLLGCLFFLFGRKKENREPIDCII